MRALNERRPFVKRRGHTFVRLRVVSRTAALHCSPAKSRMSANGSTHAIRRRQMDLCFGRLVECELD